MSYLYGDSTPSRLESNFIQFLSDAMDVSVHLLLSGERMRHCGERISALRDGAEQEIRLLEGLSESVKEVVEGAPKGDPASPTAVCAGTIALHVAELVQKQIAEVQAALAINVAAVEAEDGIERLGCLKSLETLLVTHDPPNRLPPSILSIRRGLTFANEPHAPRMASNGCSMSKSPPLTRLARWREFMSSFRSSR